MAQLHTYIFTDYELRAFLEDALEDAILEYREIRSERRSTRRKGDKTPAVKAADWQQARCLAIRKAMDGLWFDASRPQPKEPRHA